MKDYWVLVETYQNNKAEQKVLHFPEEADEIELPPCPNMYDDVPPVTEVLRRHEEDPDLFLFRGDLVRVRMGLSPNFDAHNCHISIFESESEAVERAIWSWPRFRKRAAEDCRRREWEFARFYLGYPYR
jgi:hypothetical protein